jgi:hypothetical protein
LWWFFYEKKNIPGKDKGINVIGPGFAVSLFCHPEAMAAGPEPARSFWERLFVKLNFPGAEL